MDFLVYVMIGVLAVLFCFGTLTLWQSKEGWVRALVIFLVCISLTGSFFAGTQLLGRPKPPGYELGDFKEADVLSWSFDAGVTIHAVLLLDGQDEPKLFALEWDEDLANELEQARMRLSGMGERRGRLRLRRGLRDPLGADDVMLEVVVPQDESK